MTNTKHNNYLLLCSVSVSRLIKNFSYFLTKAFNWIFTPHPWIISSYSISECNMHKTTLNLNYLWLYQFEKYILPLFYLFSTDKLTFETKYIRHVFSIIKLPDYTYPTFNKKLFKTLTFICLIFQKMLQHLASFILGGTTTSGNAGGVVETNNSSSGVRLFYTGWSI